MPDREESHPEDLGVGADLAIEVLEAQLAEHRIGDPRARWLARRGLGVGCSDLPAVWLALGLASLQERREALEYLHQRADWFHVRKAGTGPREPRVAKDARRGRHREPDLFKHWIASLKAGRSSIPVEAEIDPRTVVHIEAHPTLQRLLPITDRHERRLWDSTDAVALTHDRRLVVVQGKCIVQPIAPTTCPWYWSLQVQGEIAVTDADFGLVICGEGWSAQHGDDWRMHVRSDSIRAYLVARDDALIATIRRTVHECWDRIVGLRERAAIRLES